MKTIVIQTVPCPNCGKPMPAGALAGLCPACLLAQGVETDGEGSGGQKRFEPLPLEEIAKLFPQLEILSLLGAGGMGAVYKARQPALDRVVALKILPARDQGGAYFAERFNREARALARLSHPNIVGVHEFGLVGVLHFFIMEFVDGANLRQLERAGRLSPREALQIIPQICDALQYAHDEGVVHRDIKPENVLVDRKGRVKIADFGLAKILGQDAESLRLTREGQVMGTPHYMAPEQVEKPLTVDHRADIYSLGVVFYEMLTGDLPLGKFAPPSRKVEVDVRFDEVVLRALENDPERRFQHASEVKSRVETISGTPAPAAPAGPAPEQNSFWWAGFPVVVEQYGVRRVNRKEMFKAFGILFGVLTIVFGLVSLVTGRTWFGWLGISGSLSLQLRLLIAVLVAAFGVWHALRLTKEAPAPHGNGDWWWSRKPGAAVIGVACLVLIGVVAEQRIGSGLFKRNRAQVAVPDPATGGWAADLPGGARIELLAVGNSASANGAWWTPDGKLLNGAGFEVKDRPGMGALPDEEGQHNFLVFRTSNLPMDLPHEEASPLFGLGENSPFDVSTNVFQQGRHRPDLRAVHVYWNAAKDQTTVRAGIGLSPWDVPFFYDVAEEKGHRNLGAGDPAMMIRVHQISEEAGGLKVTLVTSRDNPEWQRRFVAFDQGGKARTVTGGFATGGGDTTTWTYLFKDLELSDVDQFQLQAKRLNWTEFRNVMLQARGSTPAL